MKWLARVSGVVLGVLIALSAFGSSVASADPFAGKTYADAAAKIAEWKATSTVATVSGSQLALPDCIVVSSSKGNFRDSSGDTRGGEYLLNLNCNRTLASPGHPGGSLLTPAGRQEKKDEINAAKIAKNPAVCESTDDAGKWCARICKKTGLCEYEA